MDKCNRVYDESDQLSEDFAALLCKAGLPEYVNLVRLEGISFVEDQNLLSYLALYESDGSGDTEEWNLFTQL
ncbi:hypothetical protein BDV25DRAFT_156543 [Aspergillus avenaceus]|uniref:Uncharacterized protein n=1 Tax=Aspergillus avenaceus TaxID=36643 RepID=A0A5N6TSL3_ASPAV|nr:hypothetical protein BDV25DRAFT_156543 [Aspergillus avenaceus]